MECTVTNLSKFFKGKAALNDVSATFPEGKITVILGPSGSGKTTLLRCVAGLETADTGKIMLGGRAVFDSAKSVNVPPHKRDIGMVFQSYGLWPHLTVAGNIGFPLKVKGMASAQIGAKVRWALDMVGMPNYGDRMPGELSGGEQQRVALARAFASEPGVLLMDEPLSNLDALLRESVRVELKELQRRLGITMIYITHDQSEALALADQLIVMTKAAIAQRGDPKAVYERPADPFVAGFLGAANLVPARILSRQGDTVEIGGPAMLRPARVSAGNLPATGDDALLMIRPEDLVVAKDAGTALWSGKVRQRLFQGDRYIYIIDLGGDARVHLVTPNDVVLEQDAEVNLTRRSETVGLVLAPEGASEAAAAA